jgi:hypothetical protein
MHRRALVAVQVLVMLTVLLGFAALTVDIGTLYRARAELQVAADAAALAAASAYTTDTMLQVRLSSEDPAAFATVLEMASTRAATFGYLNDTLGWPTLIQTSDVVTGWLDVTLAASVLNTAALPTDHNAVQVMVRREKGGGTDSNGPVELFFAPVFGKLVGETSASAVAVFDDRFAGYDLNANGAGALPFSVHKNIYLNALAAGADEYAYDGDIEDVALGSDRVPEINLYPHDAVPGNFGLLNIGSPNQGVPELRDQIENGISPADMEAEVGTSEVIFVDDNGSPVTYQISGNPGMKTSLESSIEERAAEVVAFFIHGGVTGTGANSIYNIVDIRFGRVMGVRLIGPPTQRGLWIQPVTYNGGGVMLGGAAASSNGMVGRLVLAR